VIAYSKGKHLLQTTYLRFVTENALFSLVVFFAINPYFFIRLRESLSRQAENATTHSHSPLSAQSWMESVISWLGVIGQNPLLLISIVACAVLTLAILVTKKFSRLERLALLIVHVGVLFNILFTVSMYRLFTSETYLAPNSPILLCDLVFLATYLAHKCTMNTAGATALVSMMLLGSGFTKIIGNYNIVRPHLFYKNTQQYNVYEFIRQQVQQGSSVAHDHTIPLPETMDLKGYHYWQHSIEELRPLRPDYVIYDSKFQIRGHYQPQTLALMDIAHSGEYQKIATFQDHDTQHKARGAERPDKRPFHLIEVWKRKVN
jgi:hypothetical protein